MSTTNTTNRELAPATDLAPDLDARFRAYCETYSVETSVVVVGGLEIIVHPRVYRAESASTTATMLESLGSPTGLDVLDMGCGTGVLGVHAAIRGANRVVLCDISAQAVANSQANVARHRLDATCSVQESDLFSSVASTDRFDLILFNMPFLYAHERAGEITVPAPEHLAAAIPPPDAFIDVGYRTIRRFLEEAPRYLTTNGAIRCSFASFGNLRVLDEILDDCGLRRETIARHREDDFDLEYLAYEIRPRRRA